MNTIIQRLGINELEVAKLSTLLFLEQGEVVTNDKKLTQLLQKNSNYFIVATQNDQVVGRLVAYEFELFKDNTKEMYLYEVDVVEEYKRQGIATKLIEYIKTLCQENSVTCMYVGTEPDNIPAQNLYIKTGGHIEGNLPHFTYYFDLDFKT